MRHLSRTQWTSLPIKISNGAVGFTALVPGWMSYKFQVIHVFITTHCRDWARLNFEATQKGRNSAMDSSHEP